jgi:hypothetical protein
MCKVNYQQNLQENEDQCTSHSDTHDNSTEHQILLSWNEEESDDDSNDKQPLKEPEPILYVRSRVLCAPNADHDERHQEEEDSESQHDPVHRDVPNDKGTDALAIVVDGGDVQYIDRIAQETVLKSLSNIRSQENGRNNCNNK